MIIFSGSIVKLIFAGPPLRRWFKPTTRPPVLPLLVLLTFLEHADDEGYDRIT